MLVPMDSEERGGVDDGCSIGASGIWEIVIMLLMRSVEIVGIEGQL